MKHAYEVVGEMLEYFDSYRLATWAPIAAIIERERAEALEQAALLAEEWRDENRAGAVRARKSISEGMRNMAEQLDGAATECHAIAAEIRRITQP
jgi:hypothetical protein